MYGGRLSPSPAMAKGLHLARLSTATVAVAPMSDPFKVINLNRWLVFQGPSSKGPRGVQALLCELRATPFPDPFRSPAKPTVPCIAARLPSARASGPFCRASQSASQPFQGPARSGQPSKTFPACTFCFQKSSRICQKRFPSG